MMDLTYYQQLRVNTSKTPTGLFQLILTTDHTWFSNLHQSALFEPKQVFLLYISTKVNCKNKSLNHSDSWHLILQTCFHHNLLCFIVCTPVMQYCKWKKPLQCRFWHIFTAYFHHLNEFQNLFWVSTSPKLRIDAKKAL